MFVMGSSLIKADGGAAAFFKSPETKCFGPPQNGWFSLRQDGVGFPARVAKALNLLTSCSLNAPDLGSRRSPGTTVVLAQLALYTCTY